MPTQEGTIVQLDATNTATNQALLAQVQDTVRKAQEFKASLDLTLLEFNNSISGGTTANLEAQLGLIAGEGTVLFNCVNGGAQAMYGTAQNNQIENIASQIVGP